MPGRSATHTVLPEFILTSSVTTLSLPCPSQSFFNNLLMSASTGPSESGSDIKLSADTPHNVKKLTFNVEQVTHLRNYFGKDCGKTVTLTVRDRRSNQKM